MNKAFQQKKVDTSQFSSEDWKRLTEYVSLLMTIEGKMRKKTSVKKENA